MRVCQTEKPEIPKSGMFLFPIQFSTNSTDKMIYFINVMFGCNLMDNMKIQYTSSF